MLEGLEAVEIKLSQLYQENYSFRFDSEYLKKSYLKNIVRLKEYSSTKLSTYIGHMTGGATPLGATYQKTGVPFLRVQNIMQNYFDLNDVVYLSTHQDQEINRSKLKKGDVLLTITGVSYGKSATVNEKLENSNINQHSVKISLNDRLNPYFLSTFLNSKYGKLQSDKNIVGVTRPALDYTAIRNFFIPNISLRFQNQIQLLVENSEALQKQSKSTYQQAEQLLLQEIGLHDFIPSQEPVNVKSFQESFGTSGRLDSEYYQVKYEEVVTEITRQNHDKLHNLVEISKSIEPGSANYEEYGLPFIRVSDYSKFGVTTPDKYLSDSFVLQNKELIKSLKPKKGTILFSKDGSVGTAYHLREDKSFITSGAILHLKVKDESKIIPEYLTLALNSKMVKMQAERDAGGSIILHWRVGEIENIVVPVIPTNKQKQIAELIEKSFSLKKQSEQLLEVAKEAVEKAIEESEEVAQAWLNKEIGLN